MKQEWKLSCESYLETVAQTIAKQAGEQYFIALQGELGSGKTTFVKYLGRIWGIADVKSPSYDIMHVHRGTQRTLIHIDAYRLKGKSELFLDDVCKPPFCLVVEWPECLSLSIPFDIHLQFSIKSATERWIQAT
ncbi:MAG: tRNA (adenosine(37)-N6)-threonylcarbamoyltransferase complex ATPase subunit type 1 TsaE [Opitutales bacterium]|nr:tRNA (adenosine(37)-N6)-threonylcarbamoyltransferase complex ATPase subunit type 1 TsaE [Opitutales bacterium]